MNMIPVRSSNLYSVGYDNGTMRIQFRSGRTYAYFNVPPNIHQGLMAAISHGSYFHAYIKGRYGDTPIG